MKRLWRWMRLHRHRVGAMLLALALVASALLVPRSTLLILVGGLRRHLLLSSLLIAFIALALSLLWSAGNQFDAWVFMHANMWGWRPVWLDKLMLGLTQLGSGVVALALALIFFEISQRRLAYALLLGTLALWLMVELIKAIIRRPRPYALEKTRMVGHRMPGRSFPSGHTSQAFFLASLLTAALALPFHFALGLYGVASIVGVTRLYVGAHYPRDVLAGAIFGTAFGLLTALVMTH